MAAGGKKSGDLYDVLGLKKECSDADLRIAYKKLAMRWHPDKFSASGNAKRVEEAKEKFQQIQGAYSVLSDSSKRFLYDVGAYDSDDNDDDDDNGMEEFLGEMAQMMSQTKPSESGNETFEELQQLFVEMFQSDLGSGFGRSGTHGSNGHDRASSSSMSPPGPTSSSSNGGSSGNKRDSSAMSSGKARTDGFNPSSNAFCFGINDSGKPSRGGGGGNGGGSSKRRNGRKQKVSSM
ncbi:dnaJ homolog subfamily B member 6-like isoform X2 [Ananas comosus]|uniref:DnaJ homolog subfamily B member 6-like isoform X1 n=1 Tax=Ananas comosus TaxID=4615 RepID=A0A6P5GWD5_ANACO|nr:dnaJ homolog subfamily B member 6-like isoform X1 [Ananas comosus]XP_020112096.1 dnaJ homolog subfamily B member 6-like isoform X2 [Ananas comosus]